MTEEQTDKAFLVFEDTKCKLAIKATHYEDDGINLHFYSEDRHDAFVTNYGSKEHVYTIVEGVIAKGSMFTNSIGSMKLSTDAGSISCKLDIKVNHEKLNSFLKSFDSDLKAGRVTEEEIFEQVQMDIKDFVEVEYKGME